MPASLVPASDEDRPYRLVPVDEIPPRKAGLYDRVLADFCESDCDSARVQIGGRSRSALVAGLLKAAMRAKLKVRVVTRGERVYVARDD